MEHYAAHAKRVRRKRARVPSGVVGGGKLGLGTAGWIVRYEWKAGWFAELKGELDAARRFVTSACIADSQALRGVLE
jgi:hypothetical protein